MATITNPQKGSTVNGTKKSDKINILNKNIDNLIINANSGDDIINVQNGEYKTTVRTGNGKNTLNLINTNGTVSVVGGSGADTINIYGIDEENKKITSSGGTYSINADKGDNKININSTGKFSVTTGKNNDTFNIQGGDKNSSKTFKAGAGTNTFNIYNSKDLGKITIQEQSVSAKNIINFKYGINNVEMTRNGNNLIFSWDNSTINLKNYYATNKKYASWTFKIKGTTYSYSKLLKTIGTLNIKNVKGTIPTTSYNDVIYLDEYMGKTAISTSNGNDTIVFNNLSNEEEFNNSIKLSRVNNNLVIKYSDSDTLTLKNYFSNKSNSIKTLVAGDYSVDFATFCSNYVQNNGAIDIVVSANLASASGTENSEVINATNAYYMKDKKTVTGITIKALDGNDTIKATKYDDKIYGGKGADTINAGKGKNYLYFNKGDGVDTIISGGGTDTLVFNKILQAKVAYDKANNLIIQYSDDDYVILKDYSANHSAKYIKLGTKTHKIADIIQQGVYVDTPTYETETETEVIVTPTEPIVIPITDGEIADTTKYAISGDTIIFKVAADLEYIQDLSTNNLAIKFSSDEKGNSVILKNYFSEATHAINKLQIGSNTYVISDEIQKGITILGTNSNETINGLNGKNLIFGYAGDDEIHGQNDEDEIYGQDGNDTIYGGKGKDKINGGAGNDTIYGGDDNDTLVGGAGNDTIYGDSGNDIIYGQDGSDTIYGGTGDDVIYGNDGADIIYSGAGADKIYGGKGNDEINIDEGSADLYFSVGDGIDRIYGISNSATLHFENNTNVSYALENENSKTNLIISYGNNGDKVVIPDYDAAECVVNCYYVGAIRYDIDTNDLGASFSNQEPSASINVNQIAQQIAAWNSTGEMSDEMNSYINELTSDKASAYSQFMAYNNSEN